MSRTKLKPPVLEGLIADRPSAGVAGRIYIATDERKVYRDTGTAWEEITAVERLADHEAKKTDVHGVASPDEIAGKSYVDDSISAHEGKALDGVHKVLTGNEADMPPAGEAGRIYIATDTLKIFRDTGTEWKELTAVGRLNTHEGKNTGVHGVGTSYICKTSRSDQLPSWGDIPDKPSEFPPEPHTHPISDITDIVNIAELRRDTSANRPTAGTAGRIFFETDTKRVLFDDGSAWLQLGVAKWDNLEGKPSQFPPEPHASSHRVGGADQLFDQNLNTTDSVKFANLEVSENINAGIITHFGAWGSEPAIPRLNNVLALADRRFTVTVSATPTSGSVSNMFDHSFTTDARWNTTVTYPVTIEIDFGATYHYFTKIGVYFIYGRYAGYVKIEVYNTNNSAWETLKEVSGNKSTHVYWVGGQSYVGKIRITIDEPTANPYDEIAIALIYAESSHLYRYKGGGHPHFPNLMINGAEVITPDRVLQNIASINQSIIPSSDNSYDLGSGSSRWRLLYLATGKGGSTQGIYLNDFGAHVISAPSGLNRLEFYRESSGIWGIFNRTLGKWLFYVTQAGDKAFFSGKINDLRVALKTGGVIGFWYDLRGESRNLAKGRLVEVTEHPTIDFTDYNPQGIADYYGCRIVGFISPRYSETYTFYVTSDDGVRVWFNGRLVVDAWRDQGATTYSWTATLTANYWYPIVIEHYEHGGSERLLLEWESSSQAREVVPAERLAYSSLDYITSTKALWGDVGVVAGKILFGDYSSGATFDVNLYRSEANVLKTDDKFDASALRISGTEVITSGRVLQNIASVAQSLLPSSDNAYDLGSSSYRWANVYGVNIYASAKVRVGDLEFENKWKFTEHPKYGIVLVSPKGKKYRLVLEEIAE